MKEQFYVHFIANEDKVLVFAGFYHSLIHQNKIPKDAIEITKEEHEKYLLAMFEKKQSLWLDDDKKIQFKDHFSKWDKKKKTFVPDEDAALAYKRSQLKIQARHLIDKYIKYTLPYYFDKYTKEQQKQLNNYLDLLHNEKMTELPIKPDFLG